MPPMPPMPPGGIGGPTGVCSFSSVIRVSVVITSDAIEEIPRLEGSFDLVFIDAKKEEYLKYLQLVEERLHKQSVVVADNAGIYVDRMKDFLNYVRSSGKYKSIYVPVGKDGLEISTKL